ncbi:MAG TPA: tripartite tricarboxylate transporter substrate-binding protein, partial [Xanthobacteraceae bacterium]
PASADIYPSRPVRIVVPYSAGGITDILGRALAQKLSEAWGQPVIVENKPAGGGLVGVEYVAKSPPDGYTLLALLWQILAGRGFPNQFFCDSWVVGFWRADHGGKVFELGRRAWTLAQAVLGSFGSQSTSADVPALCGGADRAR